MRRDVVIVGGGIVGCTVGYFLARAGLTVAIFERGEIARATTANSFAWANASSKTNERAYHDLNAAGVAGYRALERVFGAQELGMRATGALQIVDAGNTAGLRDLRNDYEALGAFGYPAEMIDRARLDALEPALNIPADASAMYCPFDLSIDAPRFTRLMAAQVVALGGDVIERSAPVELLASDAGEVRGLRLVDGEIATENVILAAGADTPEVLAALTGYDGFATRFPMRRAPGLLLTTPPLAPEALPHRVVYASFHDECHLLPEFNGGIKIGADDVDGLVLDEPSRETLHRAGRVLLERARHLVPALGEIAVEDCNLGVGIRPYPTDGRTIAGALPGADGLYVVVTHSGVTLAPVLGRLMAQMLENGETPDLLAPFGLERFPGFS